MRLQMLLMMRLMPLKSRLTVELRKRLQDNGPLYSGPVYKEPVYKEPVFKGPMTDGPIYNGPINKGLIYNSLINNGPILCDNGRKAPVFFKTRF